LKNKKLKEDILWLYINQLQSTSHAS